MLFSRHFNSYVEGRGLGWFQCLPVWIYMCACVYMHIYTHLYLLPLQIHVVHSVRAKTTTAFLKQGPTVLLLLVGSHCPVLLISVRSLQ